MDKSNHKAHGRTHNRGVNITSEEFAPAEENASLNASDFPSLCNVKNELQNAIDVMGPGTPHLIYTTSSVDADNEESLISSTSIFSSILQIKPGKTKNQGASTYEGDTPRDISDVTANQDSESLIMVQDYMRDNPVPFDKQSRPLVVPAVLPPAVLCMNPGCMCTHSVTFPQQMPDHMNAEDRPYNNVPKDKKHRLSDFLGKLTKTHKRAEAVPTELYRMNITQPRRDGSPPKRFVFDLIDEAPKREVNTVGTNTKKCHCSRSPDQAKSQTVTKKASCCTSKELSTAHNSHYSGIVVTHSDCTDIGRLQDKAYYDKLENQGKLHCRNSDQNTARVDVYYFDHGNAAYYRTTDSPPIIMTELLAEKTESYATKFWAELFGSVYIAFAFLTSFILQFFRFILHSLIRPLTIGLLQLVSDYFFKPFLAVIFNAIIQPPLIFFYNTATSLRDLCDPLAEGIGYFFREISVLCKAVRLFEIRQEKHYSTENLSAQSKCECGPSEKQPSKNGRS